MAGLVDQGTDLAGIVADDIDQMLRPVGNGYDIGADEYMPPLGLSVGETLEMTTFPQPNQGLFHIEVPSLTGPMTCHLQDGRGRLLAAGTFARAKGQLDIADLKPGMYFLTVQTKGKTFRTKVIRID